MPISVSFMGGGAVNTSGYRFFQEEEPTFNIKMSYAALLMLARKFSDKISLQVSPMVAYFIDPNPIYLIEGS